MDDLTVTTLLAPLADIDDRGVYFEDSFTSWRDHLRHGAALAATLRGRLAPSRPPHVGVLLENSAGHSPQPDVVAANDHAAKLVESLGHHVDHVHLPYDGAQFMQDFLLFWANGAVFNANQAARVLGRAPDERDLEPFSLGLVEMAKKAGLAAMGPVLQRLQANALAYDTWFAAYQFDVVLSPVLSSGAPLLGEVGPLVPFDTLIARLIEYVGYTPIHNIVGAPAMSVPLYWTPQGLPIGTQFAARAGQERMLLELAYELEAAAPWAQRIPPTHV